MQTLTLAALQASQNTGQDIAWLFTIRWPDSNVTYSHRRLALDGAALPASLIDPGRLSMRPLHEFPRSESLHESELILSISLDGPENPPLRERLTTISLEGLEVEWALLFLQSDVTNSYADAIPLFRGVIASVSQSRASAELRCIDIISSRGSETFGRRLSHDEIPEPQSRAEGQMLPWIFGKPGEVELMPWRAGQDLSLERSVGVDDTVIYLRSVENLPETGSIQIGDERLDYDVVDWENNAIGAPTVPLRRSEPACHHQGAPARLIPPTGFEWLIAAHPCHSVTTLRADGILLSPSDYSIATETCGDEIQKVNLTKWPCFVSYQNSSSKEFLNETLFPNSWQIAAETTALNPGMAITNPTGEAGTELSSSAKLLRFTWQGNLANGLQRFGQLQNATLKATIVATALWEPTTRLVMRLTKGAATLSISLPRPRFEDTLKYSTTTLDLDLAPLIEIHNWDLFDGSGSSGFTAELELLTGGDPTRFFISKLGIEIEYLARSSSRLADRLTASVEGVEWEACLLENPADIIRFLLCDPRALNIPSDRIDLDSFTQASAQLASLGYVFSNRIATPTDYRALLGQLLFESRCRLITHGDLISLQFRESDTALYDSDFDFSPDDLLRLKDLQLENSPMAEMINCVQLRYGVDFSGEKSSAFRASLHQESFAQIPSTHALQRDLVAALAWHNHHDPAPIADLARFLIRRHAFHRQQLQIAAPFAAISLQPGDRISLYDDYFPLAVDQGEVQQIAFEKSHYLLARLSFPMPGAECWSHSPTTFIRIRPSGSLMEFWTNARIVATLRWDGLMTLAGAVRENAALYGLMTSPVEYRQAESRLYFGTGAAGIFTPRFTIDSSGNLHIAGSLAEGITRNDLFLNEEITATPQHLALGPYLNAAFGATPSLVYDTPSQILQLKGFITEMMKF